MERKTFNQFLGHTEQFENVAMEFVGNVFWGSAEFTNGPPPPIPLEGKVLSSMQFAWLFKYGFYLQNGKRTDLQAKAQEIVEKVAHGFGFSLPETKFLFFVASCSGYGIISFGAYQDDVKDLEKLRQLLKQDWIIHDADEGLGLRKETEMCKDILRRLLKFHFANVPDYEKYSN